MSVQSAPYYWLVCDDCGAKSTESGDYTAWSDESTAEEDAYGSEWGKVGDNHYCDGCYPQRDPDNMEDCDGSAACDSLAHVEGCFVTNPDYKETS